MFKSRKKKQQLKEAAAAAALEANTQSEIKSEIETNSKYKLLDDIHLAHDFRSSIILPQLNKDLDPVKLSKQQLHLAQLRDIPESPTMLTTQPPLSPPPLKDLDGTKQYQELAAWRHQRSQNRYSNGLFGGKQRGRPKPNQLRKYTHDEEDDIAEEETQAPAITNNELPTPPLTSSTTTTSTTNVAPFQSIINQLHEEDDSENDDIEEEEDDEELMEELYEPNSDTEENFFFQDFSSNPTSNTKKKSTPRRKSRSNKVMSKFDLSSFARDLHDNRLSVMVQRESRIIMTEDDELELEKLLERQRQRMSMMSTMVTESTESLVPPPPMPSLDLIKSHQNATATIYRPVSPNNKKEESNKIEVEQSLEVPHMNSDHGSTTTTDSNSCTSNEDHHDITITLKDDVPQKITTPIPVKSLSSSRSSNSIRSHSSSSPKVNIDQLKRSVSTNSVQSNHAPIIRKRSNLSPIKDITKDTGKSNARKSVSMDDIHINLKENEHSVTSAALDWINQTENTTPLTPTTDPTSFVYKQGSTTPVTTPTPQLSKSRSLFGSLRQVSRSKSHHHSGNGGGIKGLVRNFSSHHKPSSTTSNADAGMSRAAMAVIQHNVAKQEKQKATSVIPEESTSETTVTTPSPPQPPKRRSRSKSDANNNANNLISHLISRAASSRKHNGTKIVNMENDDAAKKRAQVVRKTIIYVQPDSLHNLLKNGGDGSSVKVPPMPSRINTSSTTVTRNTLALSDGSLSPDDETIRSREYVTATKIVRQTSVRKRVVENDTSDSKSAASSPLSETSTLFERKGSTNNKKRYQLQSVDEHDLLSIHNNNKHTSSSSTGSSSGSSNHSNNNEYMEGLELREMSDGSVVWGLVKKQGNRKSFYAPNQLHHGHYDHVDDEEDEVVPSRNMKQPPQHHHNNSLSPPPIPKRSPRRQVTPAPATDVYYSNQVNLPNLLKMMYDQQQQHPGDDSNDDDDQYEFNERAMSSVDDQLDEMMRILTSQQQQVQQH